jgi:hypothetical protein
MSDIQNTTVPSNMIGSSLIGPASSVTPPSSVSGRSTLVGDFEVQGSETGAKQQIARLTGRLNASKVSDVEAKALLEERQQLVSKQLEGAITKRELARLDYVRWSLDRIEDGKHGAVLDELESHIVNFEKIASQLSRLNDDLSRAEKNKRRR